MRRTDETDGKKGVGVAILDTGYFCIRIWKIAFTDFRDFLKKNSSRMMTMGMERMWQG